jgi:hypothetical protein
MAFSAGGVDGGVQAPEARDRPVDQLAHIVFVTHVGANELGLCAEAAQLGGQRLPGFLPAAGNDNAAAFGCERQSRCATDAGQRAGDQDDGIFHGDTPLARPWPQCVEAEFSRCLWKRI